MLTQIGSYRLPIISRGRRYRLIIGKDRIDHRRRSRRFAAIWDDIACFTHDKLYKLCTVNTETSTP